MMTVNELMEMMRLARENCEPEDVDASVFPKLVRNRLGDVPTWAVRRVEELDGAAQRSQR